MERAATETSWTWYHPGQLDCLKNDCLKKDKWREIGGYLTKGPFEEEPTSVSVSQTYYDEETQTFTLHVKGIGGRVYYDIGADPTEASNEIVENVFKTKEPHLRFVCIDPSGKRETGEICDFFCEAPLKYEYRMTPAGRFCVFETNSNYEVKYTTDGSEPKANGGIYCGEIQLPETCKYVRAVALYDGKVIVSKDIAIDFSDERQQKIDLLKPLTYSMKVRKQLSDTGASYGELEMLGKIEGLSIKGTMAYIFEKDNERNYVEYNANIPYRPEDLQKLIDFVRDTSFKNRDVVVTFEYKELMFCSGQKFNDWIDLCKLDMERLRKEGEIIQ